MGHRDARDLFEPLAQRSRHLVHTAAARFAINQPDVDAGVNFALCIAGVDGGKGVANFRKLTHDGFHLRGFCRSNF